MPLPLKRTDPVLTCEIALRWWLGELAYFVPQHCRGWFTRDDVAILKNVTTVDPDAAPAGGIEFVEAADAASREGFVLLSRNLFYIRSIEVPLVSVVALPSLVHHEAGRYNPLPSAEGCFDYVVASRNLAANTLGIDLFFLRQTVVRAVEAAALADQVTVNGACIEFRGQSQRLPHLFKPKQAWMQFSKRQRRLLGNAALAGLYTCALLALFSVRLNIAERQTNADLSQLRIAARAIEPDRVALQNGLDQMSAIHALRQRPTLIGVIADITHWLPDSAYVTHLSANNDTVEIHGEARTAATLINDLSRSPHFQDVRFVGPISKDMQSKDEQFDLALRVR